MAVNRYIQEATVEDISRYAIIFSVNSLDQRYKLSWDNLSKILEYTLPTSLVKTDLLETAATYVLYYGLTDPDDVDLSTFEDLAELLIDAANLTNKEDAMSNLGLVMVYLSEIFSGYFKMFIYIRRKYRINRESITAVSIKRLPVGLVEYEFQAGSDPTTYSLMIE